MLRTRLLCTGARWTPIHQNRSNYATKAKKPDPYDPSEVLQRMEQLAQRPIPATMDIFSQPLELQDVHIASRYSTLPKGLGWEGSWTWLKQNLNNGISNIISMYKMAKVNAFPGLKKTIKSPLSLQLFQVGSTKPTAWLSPLQRLAFTRYCSMSEAFASGDTNTLQQLCTDPHISVLRKRLKARSPGVRFAWKCHGEASPTRCVSIRATEGFIGTSPKVGNKLFVHAIMRFDTMQTLSVYNRSGKLLQGDPHQAKRIVEYMVLEKRMWYDEPWMIRQQLYEGIDPRSINSDA